MREKLKLLILIKPISKEVSVILNYLENLATLFSDELDIVGSF